MNALPPLPKSLLVVVALFTVSIAGILVYFVFVMAEWRRQGAGFSALAHPMVATGFGLLIVGFAMGSWECVRAIRRLPPLSPSVTFALLIAAFLIAPQCIAYGLRAQQRSAITQAIKNAQVPASPTVSPSRSQ